MAEIILYKGKSLSLGTEMNLWHVSYLKLLAAHSLGHLKRSSNANLSPEQYLRQNSVFRFRFPFPGEEKLKLGDYVDHSLRVPARITNAEGRPDTVYIMQQRCVHPSDRKNAFLSTLYRDESGMLITELTNIQEARTFVREIIRNHILNESDAEKRAYYRAVTLSILKGYHSEIDIS